MSQLDDANKKKVFVGLSGGVDSSVSAALLKEQGFDVTGVFIKTWHPEWLQCDWKADRRDAMRVAAKIKIPFLTLDLEEDYKKGVADYMIDEYKNGRTPNPDIMCNKEVKFGGFLKFAIKNGADYVATGHYARVKEEDGGYTLLEGVDKNKDQSYFLWTLTQNQLKHTLFPVGNLTKPDVRTMALKYELPTARKHDSQGVCFLGDIDMKEFLKKYIEENPDYVLNTKGDVIGTHEGALFYTIGERHGFTITKKGTSDPKMFVVGKDVEKNTITVSPKPSNPGSNPFIKKNVELDQINYTNGKIETGEYLVRFRYRQNPIKGNLAVDGDKTIVEFNEPQHGISPGQSIVIYDGEECLGGGIIK